VRVDGSYLAALLKQVVADLGKYKDRGAITDDTPEVHGLCFVLEKIFLHELKTGVPPLPLLLLLIICCYCFSLGSQDTHASSLSNSRTGPRGNIWEFIERLQDSLPVRPSCSALSAQLFESLFVDSINISTYVAMRLSTGEPSGGHAGQAEELDTLEHWPRAGFSEAVSESTRRRRVSAGTTHTHTHTARAHTTHI
jgi:hypothetical protein